MTPQRHAKLARDLIAACNGLDEATTACRLNRSRLSEFQNWRSGSFMPADVVADLEAYCGEAIYSRALFEARPSEPVAGDALGETHDVALAAAALLPLAMDLKAGKAGAMDRYREGVSRLVDEVDDVEAIAENNVQTLRVAS